MSYGNSGGGYMDTSFDGSSNNNSSNGYAKVTLLDLLKKKRDSNNTCHRNQWVNKH
jgi:hypothetical protein